METYKPIETPMSTSTKLDTDDNGKNVDVTKYRGMIRSLLYLTASRPDIIFSVCICARYQSCPKESHLSLQSGTSGGSIEPVYNENYAR